MPVKTILGIGAGLFGSSFNQNRTQEMNQQNAKLNQHYWNIQNEKLYNQNEQAAQNAMERTIDLYNLLQSPSALVEQYKKAGLNPALLYGMGGSGGKVIQGPQGNGGQQGNGTPILGLQNFLNMDPLTLAQMENIEADTRKKNADTKLTESQKKTQELINEYKELENNFNKENYGYRVQKYIAETTSAVELANIDRINGKISEATWETQIETIGQNLLLIKAKESLLKSQKNLTNEQVNETLQKINLMSAQIWELSSNAELNEEQLTKMINDREWNYLSITDAKWIVEQSIDVLKSILDLLPMGKMKTLVNKIISQKTKTPTT